MEPITPTNEPSKLKPHLKQIIIGTLLLCVGLISGLALNRAKRNDVFSQNSIIIKNGSSTLPTVTGDQAMQDELRKLYEKGQSLAHDTEKNITGETQTIHFLAVGDISLSRSVAQAIKNTGDVLSPFEQMKGLLAATDFNFGNLETPFSNTDAFSPSNTLVFNAPKKNIEGLKHYNFKIVNLANNHAMDQGETGLKVTREWLDTNGIQHIGTGNTLDDAYAGQIVTVKNTKVGFIGASYASLNDGGKANNTFVARIEDKERLKKTIESVKKQVDVVVVTMHAGDEYTREPNQAQKDFAHAAVDAGADIVIGAHPHWVQTIEKYNGKYIFYSLGNFVFDQDWSQDTKEGLVLDISVEGKKQVGTHENQGMLDDLQGMRNTQSSASISQIKLIPIVIEKNYQPRVASDQEAKKILEKIHQTETILK